MAVKRLHGRDELFGLRVPRRGLRGHRETKAVAADRSVAAAITRFALSGLAAVVLVGFVAVRVLQSTGRNEAIRDAKIETRLAGQGIVAPAVSPQLLAGDPGAIAHMDRIVRQSVRRDPVVRVKLWDAAGRVLYSDEHPLIGARYPLGENELKALRTGGVDAEVSDLSKPENRFERSEHKLLEVYLGIDTPSGHRLLFEDYLRYSSVAASGRRLWLSFAPALLVTLVLLELAQIPMAWSLARRVRGAQAERVALLRRAIDASEMERRRIARDLHDGAVQNLAGVSYSLSAAADAIERGEPDSAVGTIRNAAGDTRHSIRELRTLLVDIYPPNLRREGLSAALSDLVAPLRSEGIEVQIDVERDMRLPPHAESLLYRVAQEAVRNVATHARAQNIRLATWQRSHRAGLSVTDDGLGLDRTATADAGRHEHFGLRILEDLARDSGGELTIKSEPGSGTSICIEVPV